MYLSPMVEMEQFVHVDAPHDMTGEHKGFWSWTLRAAAQRLVNEGALSAERPEKFVAGMNEADASPYTMVAHCRMHLSIAKKPADRV